MEPAEYASYDALGLADLIRRGEVTAHEVGEAALAAIAAVDPAVNAVIDVHPDRVEALRDAAPPTGPFGGVPFLRKDLGEDEAGELTENGSLLTKGYRSDADSTAIKRFRAAGLLILGRSTIPEWAWSTTCRTPLTGLTVNPWDPSRAPNGSSSGAAAAVAAGMVPIAGGGDAGGSIRGPASFCGVVGLKISRGRVSDAPWVDTINHMAVHGALTRTVRDTAAAIDALAGPEPGDLSIAPPLARPLLDEVGAPTGRLRVALSTTPPTGDAVDPEVVATVEAVGAVLESLGHTVVEAEPIIDGDALLESLHVTWATYFTYCIDAYAAELGVEPSLDNLMATSLATYLDGRRYSGTDLLVAHDRHNEIRRSVSGFLVDHDVWVTPTNTRPATPHDHADGDHPDFADDAFGWTRHMFATEMFLPTHNIAGTPAISLPLGMSSDGLPIGVQFAARYGDEATLIRLASVLETALPWRDRRPPIHV